jgi:hypothetical protein
MEEKGFFDFTLNQIHHPTPLWYDAIWGHAKNMEISDVNEWYYDVFNRNTPISTAICAQNTRALRYLLRRGVDPRLCCTIYGGVSMNAFEYVEDLLCIPPLVSAHDGSISRSDGDCELRKCQAIMRHHVEHQPRLRAVAWSLAQVWPDLILPVVQRLAKVKPKIVLDTE